MSNKTDLQTLNTDYAALIDTLRGKAVGGGGAVETCEVKVVNDTDYDLDLIMVTPTGFDIPYMMLRSEETYEVLTKSLLIIMGEEAGISDLDGDVEVASSFDMADGMSGIAYYVSGNSIITHE